MGPRTEDIPNATPNMETKRGRLLKGTSGIVIIMPPEKMPADPKPAIARPRMKAVELGAAPHSADPTSKITIESKKTHLVEYS